VSYVLEAQAQITVAHARSVDRPESPGVDRTERSVLGEWSRQSSQLAECAGAEYHQPETVH
jgi:hypothetical protein